MRITGVMIFVFLILIFSVTSVFSLYVSDNNQALFGHVMTVKSIKMPDLSPGEVGLLNITLKNNGKNRVSDIELNLKLPGEFEFYEDVSKIKISEMKSGQEKLISYRIVALPSSIDGIYGANITVDYTSNYGANYINVGQTQQDIFDLGLEIRSEPSIFVILEESEIYSGSTVGEISLKFINDGTTDIKFLTVDLSETDKYSLLVDKKNYVGDLDSDDFQTVEYKIKLNREDYTEVELPIIISYKDSLNKEYSNEFKVTLNIRDAKDVGVSSNNYYILIVVGIIILIIIIVIVIVRRSRRKK
ncbi:hypothetical protein GOV12_01180 [Candidatus Pacearchaeota archaeon]|nr:hypothetical protein [Candidatus Pacearchaeota archaeon]